MTWIVRALNTFWLIVLASLITGGVMTWLDITADKIVREFGLDMDVVLDSVEVAINWIVIWSVPNIIVGAIIIVPVWLVLALFGPKRNR
ncbi:MAG: hypothetical protein JKY49_05805 [Cohaesibacteraceae bacterium]|nr:hypothetical protein [Cohaesibacteraceae bacterium]MBL4875445.1 hypothetical protein [Cohaesibacteraceae bacterium]